MFTPPAGVEAVLAAFTRPSWRRAQALLCGALLAPAGHVLTAALRVLGLAADRRFQDFHRLLKQLAAKLGVSLRLIEKWSSTGIIPKLPISPRMSRYQLHEVLAALERYETAKSFVGMVTT